VRRAIVAGLVLAAVTRHAAAQGKDSLAATRDATPAKADTVPVSRPAGRAVVTAVTQGLVYVDAGRNAGVRVGTVLHVPRLGDRGVYRVAFLSSKSASARADSTSALPEIGDTAVFTPAADDAVVAERRSVARAGGGAPATSRRHERGLRGRIGIRYLGTSDKTTGIALRQPGLELLLNGPVTPGAPVGLNVDIRSRRTVMYRPGEDAATQALMGVYQAAVRFQAPRGPVRLVLGRQYAPTLAGVGLFDGALVDIQRPRWGAGVMGGLAPEPGSLGFSSEIRQGGGYFQGRSSLTAPVRWSLTLGGMGSYDQGQLNREFGFFQGTLSSRVVTAVLLQELDLNRGWKLAAGEPRLALTSTFFSLNLTPTRWFAINGGVDNRRNVRLYRDLVTPEEVFDDRFRFGVWGGASLTIARKLRIGADTRRNSVQGADSLQTTAVSATLNLDRITPLGLGLRARATHYETPGRGPGWLYVGAFRVAPGSIGALEATGGSRQEMQNPTSDRFWAGVNAEFFVRRSWFGLFSFTREWGRNGATPTTDQLYAGLSYRF
jgi:hypothetical protein